MKRTRALIASITTAAVLALSLPAVAHDEGRYARPIGADCSQNGDSAIVSWDQNQPVVYWTISEEGRPIQYGETDSITANRYTVVLDTVPGIMYSVYVRQADLGERLRFSYEWVNVNIIERTFVCEAPPAPVVVSPSIQTFYDSTAAPRTYLEWLRDVYRRLVLSNLTLY